MPSNGRNNGRLPRSSLCGSFSATVSGSGFTGRRHGADISGPNCYSAMSRPVPLTPINRRRHLKNMGCVHMKTSEQENDILGGAADQQPPPPPVRGPSPLLLQQELLHSSSPGQVHLVEQCSTAGQSQPRATPEPHPEPHQSQPSRVFLRRNIRISELVYEIIYSLRREEAPLHSHYESANDTVEWDRYSLACVHREERWGLWRDIRVQTVANKGVGSVWESKPPEVYVLSLIYDLSA